MGKRTVSRMPPAQCDTYGCKAPARPHSRYCAAHAPTPKAKPQGRDDLYKSKAWLTMRMGQLSKDPLCAACRCDGRVTAASHVDHVFPWREIGEHAFRAAILQSLCPACHSVKTGLEQKGIIRHYAPDGPIDYELADYWRIVGQ